MVPCVTLIHEKCRSVSQNQQNFILSDKIFFSVRQMSGRNYQNAQNDDTGYPHDGRADNAAYRHDRRADKRRYPHDREIDIQILKVFRSGYILS